MSNENKIVITICIALFLIVGYLFWRGPSIELPSTKVENSELLVRADSHMTGSISAKVIIVEFGDFQCPACAIDAKEMKKVLAEYKDNPNFNFVFRHFPLQQHQNAVRAAEATEAAGAQGKFFEMMDILYENRNDWGESADPLSYFDVYAKELGLNIEAYKTSMANHEFLPKIQADFDDATALFINHTPTVYVNGVEQTNLKSEAIIEKVKELLNN